jgi:hypothetical protein
MRWDIKFSNKKKKEFTRLEFALYIILLIIPTAIFISFIHESGHLIMAYLLGWEAFDIHITNFPFGALDNSYIFISPRIGATETEYLLVGCAGSLHTLIWAYIFFYLYYKHDLHFFIELFFFLYSIIMLFEGFCYILLDLFYFKFADWYLLYLSNSIFVGLFLILYFTNFFLFFYNIDKITNQLSFSLDLKKF